MCWYLTHVRFLRGSNPQTQTNTTGKPSQTHTYKPHQTLQICLTNTRQTLKHTYTRQTNTNKPSRSLQTRINTHINTTHKHYTNNTNTINTHIYATNKHYKHGDLRQQQQRHDHNMLSFIDANECMNDERRILHACYKLHSSRPVEAYITFSKYVQYVITTT